VHRLRGQFLARAGFARNQGGADVRRQPADQIEDLLHRRTAANHSAELELPGEGQLRVGEAPVRRELVAGAGQGLFEARDVERLGEVVDGAQLDGLDGRIDAGVSRHQRDPGVGVGLAQRANDFETTDVGHPQIDERDVGMPQGGRLDGLAAVRAGRDLEAFRLRDPAHHAEHPRLVVDDQQQGPIGVAVRHAPS